MTTLLLDADSLIKLTKSQLKEAIVKNFDVIIPPEVKYECVEKAVEKSDAIIISKNIREDKIRVIKTNKDNKMHERDIKELGLLGGEQDVYRLSKQIEYNLISSDDRKFLRLLHFLNFRAVTPSALLVLLFKNRRLTKEKAKDYLHLLQPYISDEEYELCYLLIGG